MKENELYIITFIIWYIFVGVYVYGKTYRSLLNSSRCIPREWKHCRLISLYCAIILPIPTLIVVLIKSKFRNTKGFQFTFYEPPFDMLANQEVDFKNNVDIWYNENPFLVCRDNIKDNIEKYWEKA